MRNLVYLFWSIALRRRGPEDLPASAFLFGVTLLAYIFAQLPIVLPGYGLSARLLGILMLDLVAAILFVWVVLILAGHRQRYLQTITAWLGVGILLALVAAPFSLWWQNVSDAESMSSILPLLVLFSVVVWSIAANAHILAQAISRPFAIGLLIALGYFFLSYRLMGLLPPPEI